mmetsp:Transcript_75337/g.243637  ORF Transcript_75337/g.243637 Transcript_75337/m.243637 type:complete len:383 (+) Transcript_75337:144-1292(+)
MPFSGSLARAAPATQLRCLLTPGCCRSGQCSAAKPSPKAGRSGCVQSLRRPAPPSLLLRPLAEQALGASASCSWQLQRCSSIAALPGRGRHSRKASRRAPGFPLAARPALRTRPFVVRSCWRHWKWMASPPTSSCAAWATSGWQPLCWACCRSAMARPQPLKAERAAPQQPRAGRWTSGEAVVPSRGSSAWPRPRRGVWGRARGSSSSAWETSPACLGLAAFWAACCRARRWRPYRPRPCPCSTRGGAPGAGWPRLRGRRRWSLRPTRPGGPQRSPPPRRWRSQTARRPFCGPPLRWPRRPSARYCSLRSACASAGMVAQRPSRRFWRRPAAPSTSSSRSLVSWASSAATRQRSSPSSLSRQAARPREPRAAATRPPGRPGT